MGKSKSVDQDVLCKSCLNGQILYVIADTESIVTKFIPSGFVKCRCPRFKGHDYMLRIRKDCGDYTPSIGRFTKKKE